MTIVTTTHGAVRGTGAFRNIPYAAPPLGAARFAAPRPHPPWEGVRDGTTFGPNAPQSERRLGDVDMSGYFGDGWHRGEDYLTVNVWTPDAKGSGAPVMVFVHGGGFVAGSNRAAYYDGSTFARDGVVLVTVNYRLGIAGFLDLPDAPANRGLLDVVAGLRWVRENIAAFGGDPDNVTLFGQSAGATIVGGVLATPDAAGLFRRAIIQSGSGLGAFSREQGARVARAAAEILGVGATAEALGQLTDEQLVEAAAQLAGLDLRTADHRDPLIGLSPFSLVSDVQPADAVATGMSADVDLLIGTNTEEGNLYLIPVGRYDGSTSADVHAVAALAHPEPERLVTAYRRNRPDATDAELRSAILGDALFGAGSWALSEAHSQNSRSRTFGYEFGRRDPRLGATHTIELPYVFGDSDVHDTWIRFARTGDPGWEPFEADRRATMHIGATWEQVDDPRGPERLAWRRRTPVGAPVSASPLSRGIRKGNILQVSGQLPYDPATGELSGSTVSAQTAQALRNVIAVLEAGGAHLADVVMLRVYLAHPGHLNEMNEAYAALVGRPYPARTTVYMQLPPGVMVEVDALAVLS
ncbi:carboxylesterase family protein [Jidongwangia harbinensis]|uniref:carboxylesterase family protein n=1 Tax=Jidongwangia harbinensis TaxID=2878561 RepID=UPI001CDA3329|nr:carboxylesterase family protein [Jidongwangia harbinensis]MCA2216539.1 carboxylesterase family protein [Jidongwangia harbinensis]